MVLYGVLVNLHEGEVCVGDETEVVLQPLLIPDPLSLSLPFLLPLVTDVPQSVTQVLQTQRSS